MNEKNGWVKLHRKMLDNPVIMKDAEHLAVWMYLLLNATHAEYPALFQGKKIMLQPGQLITGRKSIADTLSINESKVRRIMDVFESDQQIDRQRSNKNTLVSLKNWDRYQVFDLQNDQQMTNNRPTTDQQVTTNNNDNNVKNEKNEINTISDSAEPESPAPGKKTKKKKESKEEPVKHKIGEFQHVLLTENEFVKLANDFGIDLRDKAIKFLDEYIEEKGYKSKSHNLAIRRWVIDAVKEQEQKKGSGRKEPVPSWMNKKSSAEKYMGYGQRQYSADEMDDLEAKLLGVKTAGNDPGIAARAEELKKQFS